MPGIKHPRESTVRPIDEVPRERWRSFFKALSQSHEGWLATLNIFERGRRAQALVHDGPFQHMSLDEEAECIVITFIAESDARFTHIVEAPNSVLVEVDGVEKAILIDSKTGTTEVRFRSALPTEMADGIVQ